jgi:hypothetical protein
MQVNRSARTACLVVPALDGCPSARDSSTVLCTSEWLGKALGLQCVRLNIVVVVILYTHRSSVHVYAMTKFRHFAWFDILRFFKAPAGVAL